jgi:hypothetical protein
MPDPLTTLHGLDEGGGVRHMSDLFTTSHASLKGLGTCRIPSLLSCSLEEMEHIVCRAPLTKCHVSKRGLGICRTPL